MAEFEKYYGTYRCAKEQDYEKFLTTMGVSWPMRKMATTFTREFEVTYDAASQVWKFRTYTWMKSMEMNFKLNEDFEEISPDGRKVNVKVTLDGDKFFADKKATKEGEKSSEITWEFKGDEVIHTYKVVGTDVVAIQTFSRKVPENPYLAFLYASVPVVLSTASWLYFFYSGADE